MAKRVVIVGNAPMEADLGATIDAAEWVVRFNEPSQEPRKIGDKTDILFVVNSGKSMQARLANPDWLRSRLLRDAKEVILPYHSSVIEKYHPRPNFLSSLKGRRADWTEATLAMLEGIGKRATVLSAAFYEESCAELGISARRMHEVFPSTGFLGMRYCLERFPGWDTEICGFGWSGWKRHDWEAERAWTRRKLADGALRQAGPADVL